MSDPLRKVKVGDGAGRAFDTQTFNTFIDAAKFFKGRMSTRVGAGPPDLEQQVPSCRVWIRNTTGSTLLPWSCVTPTGVAPIDPETLPFNANEQPVFEVQAPTATTDPVLITMQPIAAGELGEAAALGVCVAQVNVTDGAHRFAVPVVGSTASLASAASGPVRILAPWNTGNTSRLVMLCGQAPGGGGSVTVEEVDGSPSYTGITTLRFDQADGFVLSQPSAGIARVDFGPSLTNATRSLGSTASFVADGTFKTINDGTDVQLTIPSNGTYFVFGTAVGIGNISSGYGMMYMRVAIKTTPRTPISIGSASMMSLTVAGINFRGTGSVGAIVSLTASQIICLEGMAGNITGPAVWTTSQFITSDSAPTAMTGIGYIRIGP